MLLTRRTSEQVGGLAEASVPQGVLKLVLPQAQAMLTERGQGRQAPWWQGLGHRWLPQRSFLPHGCTGHTPVFRDLQLC